jgi:hypothetical protein
MAQHTLIRAFGENSTLRELCNLVLFMGNRDRCCDCTPRCARDCVQAGG